MSFLSLVLTIPVYRHQACQPRTRQHSLTDTADPRRSSPTAVVAFREEDLCSTAGIILFVSRAPGASTQGLGLGMAYYLVSRTGRGCGSSQPM